MSGRRAGDAARRGASSIAASASDAARRGADKAADAAKRAGKSAKKSISKGADSLTQGAKRQARDAGEWISKSSKSGMKRMGKLCRNNPVKCTAGMALAGYTAVNLAENSQAQQECIAKCLPPNWPAVVESNGEVAPEYYLHDPKPKGVEPVDEKGNKLSMGSQKKKEDEHKQPQCTDGTDCEPYCVAACKAEHPTTLLGAAMEGAGEMMDDVIVPFAEDVLGIPVTDIGRGMMWGIRIGVFLVGALVIYKVGNMLGLWGRQNGTGGGRIALSINTPQTSAPAPAPAPVPSPTSAPALSDSQVQLANRAMDLAEKNPELARAAMQMTQRNQQRTTR